MNKRTIQDLAHDLGELEAELITEFSNGQLPSKAIQKLVDRGLAILASASPEHQTWVWVELKLLLSTMGVTVGGRQRLPQVLEGIEIRSVD